MARPQLSNRDWLRVQNSINDNYFVKCVTRLKDLVYVSGKLESFNPSPVLARKKDLSVTSNSETVNLHVNSCFVNPVLFAKGYLQKKCVNPSYCYHCQKKYVKDVSCVYHLTCVNHKFPNCCSRSGARLH